jgi:hypothetical protein
MRDLTDSNFVLYAARHYDNPRCVNESEFYEDVGRIKSVNRLFGRYEKTGELKYRLILNHLRVLYNVFEHEALTKMLCFRLNRYLHFLKPFLVLLNYWPARVEVGNVVVVDSCVPMDRGIVEALRKI